MKSINWERKGQL